MTGIKVFQDPPEPGQLLMDRDRELMELASRSEAGIVIRFYQWNQPTISLGYHQNEDALDFDRLSADETPWVRRPTGGAAVLHSEELTYAVVVPEIRSSEDATLVQRKISEAIASGLRNIGVDARIDSRGEPLTALSNRVSCFVRTSRWEVTVGGRKIVGSAQRKWGGAILQHGSILLGDDHVRISQYLALAEEGEREKLCQRLRAHSTSVRQELGKDLTDATLRAVFADQFLNQFADWKYPAVTDIET